METPPPLLFESSGTRWRCFGFDNADEFAPRSASFADLLLRARLAKANAYAPYSKFRVGAALLMDGSVFTGTNVENASYGGTLCAERTAIATAVATGRRKLDVIAVSTDAAAGSAMDMRTPCGLCRQVMSEFATPDLIVLLDGGTGEDGRQLGEVIRFEALLPWRFSLGVRD